jgi:hypothetical protein
MPFFEASTLRPRRMLWQAVCAAALCLLTLTANAHKASDAYLLLERDGDSLFVRWDIALRDLDAMLDLDRNGDRKLSWGEVRAKMDDIEVYATSHLRLQGGQCRLAQAQPPAVEDRIDGAYLVLQMQASCITGAALEVDYRLFREVDPTHRGLLRIESAGVTAPVLRSLDPAGGPVTLELPGARASDPVGADAKRPTASLAPSFFRDGTHHILIGYDHVLFLICLLLPVVLRRGADQWKPVLNWRDAASPMLGMVTTFTIAHSVTLALAGLKLVTLSPRVVEPGIALTIMVAAIDNIHPVLRGRRKLFSFLFGLIHGFGFAGVLSELDLPVSGFMVALLQFNLGVEAGQLLIVTVALTLLVALRKWPGYPRLVLRSGSAFAAVIAGLWFCERVFDVQLLPV